jgi:NAD(P)-dependent dehydrogenase (short-subunit alcohol dehydrogenase family)
VWYKFRIMSAQSVAIITGATSGIGRAAALRLAGEGYAVLAVGRDTGALGEVEQAVRQSGGICTTHRADVVDADAPARIVNAAIERFGALDALVNAAGIIGSGTIENTTDEAWDRMMDVNVRSVFRLTRAAAPHLVERRGAVVNVSSVAGTRSFPGILAYAVSKAAVDHLTRCAALELAPKGVRVNAVNPGVVVTNLHRRSGMGEEQYAAFLERSKETHPMGRAGNADEIADLIAFLVSPKSGWITGETISIDGGRHLTCAR